jgi:hypothetical protein
MIAAVVSLIAVVAFVAGVYSGHRKTFPFGFLASVKRVLSGRYRHVDAPPSTRFVIDIEDTDALRRMRSRLIEYVWGKDGFPIGRMPDAGSAEFSRDRYAEFDKLAKLELWRVNMAFGIDSKVLVLSPRRDVKPTAVIYHQGHEGDVSAGASVIAELLREGYYVVALAMPLLGPNSQPTIEFRRHGSIKFVDHDFFSLLDLEHQIHSVRFFLEPVIACVNQIGARGFKSIAMMGYSGGGWTTAMCAAIDERISLSFPVAGSLPFSLRGRGEMADYENHVAELYSIANYPELHILGALGNRHQLQILNEYDTVAWGGRRGKLYEAQVQETLTRLGGGRFEIMIDDSWTGHGISKAAMRRMLSLLSNE